MDSALIWNKCCSSGSSKAFKCFWWGPYKSKNGSLVSSTLQELIQWNLQKSYIWEYHLHTFEYENITLSFLRSSIWSVFLVIGETTNSYGRWYKYYASKPDLTGPSERFVGNLKEADDVVPCNSIYVHTTLPDVIYSISRNVPKSIYLDIY